MEIYEASEHVVIEAVDRGLSSSGDVELSISVCSEAFTGQGFAWVEGTRLAAFVAELRELERRRQGTVKLEGMSPEEFHLRIWSVDRWGHVAVGGRGAKDVFLGQHGPYRHAVEFGFEFDPSLLPKVLSAFQEIAGGTVVPGAGSA